MYTYDHFEEQFAYDDPEELVDRTVYLLEHPRYLEELKRANIETFENHFTPKPVVKSILDQMDLS
jgi:spore maturation protein CgeB